MWKSILVSCSCGVPTLQGPIPVTKYSVRVKIWSGRTKYASIFGPSPLQTVLLEAHAFRSAKARVTASETAREMCADEKDDLHGRKAMSLLV